MATDARNIVEGRAGATGGPGAAGASRRGFLGAGSTAALAAGLMVHSSVPAAEGIRDLRLAVVGCGGRGAGAVDDSLSINEGVTLVSAADLYVAKCAGLREAMSAAHEGKVAIDDSRMYGGLERPPSSFASPLRPPGRRYGKTESALAVGRARRAASSSGR